MARRPPVRQKRPMTAKAMAELFNFSIRTVMRAVSLPREEYLANALTRTKPWEALGISRATWYRRGKPEPTPETPNLAVNPTAMASLDNENA